MNIQYYKKKGAVLYNYYVKLNEPCSSNVLNYDTIYKFVLSDHLNKMHPLPSQLHQTLGYVQDLRGENKSQQMI